jgi:hypothetical protein
MILLDKNHSKTLQQDFSSSFPLSKSQDLFLVWSLSWWRSGKCRLWFSTSFNRMRIEVRLSESIQCSNGRAWAQIPYSFSMHLWLKLHVFVVKQETSIFSRGLWLSQPSS